MKVTELFKYIVEKGMKADPRGADGLERFVGESKKEFDALPESRKWEFDQERLWNPYEDSRILFNPDDNEVTRVMMGINIDPAEIILADRLREKGERIDLVIGHHPRGIGYPGLHKVMDIQADMYHQWGVPLNVAEQLMEPRINEVKRTIMPMNHQQPVDAARLLGVPFMVTHSPADLIVQKFMQDEMDKLAPYRVGEILDHIKSIPEYRTATTLKNGPTMVVGSEKNRAGKVKVKFAGGTGGAKTMYEAFETSDVGTLITMHLREDHIELAKKHHINVVVAGHMPSDSVGMNLAYKELEDQGLEIIRMSGLIPPS